jgi:hypothetical protein
MSKIKKHKNTDIRTVVPSTGVLSGTGEKKSGLPVPPEFEPAALAEQEKMNNRLLSSMLETYIRGSEEGATRPRAAQLIEKVFNIAMHSENKELQLAAIKFIYDRVDGKPVERKEIKSMKIQGIIYIPEAVDIADV